MKIKNIVSILVIIFLLSCNSQENNTEKKNKNKQKTDTEKEISEKNPLNISIKKEDKYIIGDKIEIDISVENILETDSVFLLINGKKTAVLRKNNLKFIWKSKNAKTGTNTFEVVFKPEKTEFRKEKSVILLSDIKPEIYSYKIKNTFKHDRSAYTQGLFYHEGFLYEATGLKGESTVRKVKLETGEIIQSFAIPKDVFGEGITMLDNKIIQITWRAEQGFVYDLKTFELADKFSYFGEGWGIAYGEEKLFMTNGTNEIKVLETQSFSVIDKLEVFDNKGEVKYLNELEYIKGEIYANIYQYEKIAKIDPKTGKIIAYINLKRILQINDYDSKTDVLNGIAYDKNTDRLFVTGKKWPKLFEIELVKN